MYLREVTVKNQGQPDLTYVQLVTSEWDPKKKQARTRVLKSLGRKDRLDLDHIRRLINSLSKYLPLSERPTPPHDVKLGSNRFYGPIYLLDTLWQQLELDQFWNHKLADSVGTTPWERLIFTLVAQRACAPASKLACHRWLEDTIYLPEAQGFSDEQLYRAMDLLVPQKDELEQWLYSRICDLFNIDVSVIFYDTTSTYFEIEEPDDPEEQGRSLRLRGYSKDKRPDLPQIIVGLVVNRDGLPLRHWVYPGNTADVTTIKTAIRDLRAFRPERFLFVGDRGCVSQETINYLEAQKLAYVIGTKMRGDEAVDAQVLSQRGRYQFVSESLQVKEVTVTKGDRPLRYIICYNPQRAYRDQRIREEIVHKLEEHLARSRAGQEHTRQACALLAHRTYGRYLRKLKSGGLRIDRAAVSREARFDGKYVLITNDFIISADKIAQGYKELMRAEQAFRTMKHVLDLRPCYHHRVVSKLTSVSVCLPCY